MSSLTLSSSPGPSTASTAPKRSHSESVELEEPIPKKLKTNDTPAPSAETVRDKKKRSKKKKKKLSVVVVEDGRARLKGSRHGLSEPLVIASPVIVKAGQSSRGMSKTPALADDLSGDERDVEEIVSPAQDTAVADFVQPEAQEGASSRDKGKGKAADPVRRTAEEEIARLTRELAFKNSQLESHQTLVSQTQQSITCQVCLELMYKPYALAPCGHLACYSCLVSWFSSPAPGPAPEALPVHMRKKTCPHCRAVVKERPAQVWGMKDIVNAFSKSGLLQGNFLPPAQDAAGANENGDASADPWDGIFRPVGRGLGLDYHDHGFVGGPGILDEEDGGMFRCYDCLHEIWDGVCSGCGREYDGDDDGFEIRDLGTDSEDDEDGDDVFPGGMGEWLGAAGARIHGAVARHLAAHLLGDDDEDEDAVGGDIFEEDEDAEGYESSFIDDDGGGGAPMPAPQPRLLRREEVVVLTSDSEDDGHAPAPRNRNRNRNRTTHLQPEVIELSGEEEEEIRRPGGRGPVAVLSDEDDEDEDVIDIDSSPVITAPARRGANRRVLVASSDEEGEDSDSGIDLATRIAAQEQELYGDDGSRPRHQRQAMDSDEEDQESEPADDDDEEDSEEEDDDLAW